MNFDTSKKRLLGFAFAQKKREKIFSLFFLPSCVKKLSH
jgi:hypothetical protein